MNAEIRADEPWQRLGLVPQPLDQCRPSPPPLNATRILFVAGAILMGWSLVAVAFLGDWKPPGPLIESIVG